MTIKPQRGLAAIKPYTPGKPIEEVQREYGLTDVIKLASNENPLGPSPKVVAALQAALLDLNFYPDARAYTLSRAIAARHGVAPDMVRIGNGADGLIRELCVSYLNDDDEVLTSTASFPVYDISTAVMRARMVKTSLKDLRFDLDAMAAAITDRTRLIFLCNPNNPTGNIVTADEVAAFMRRYRMMSSSCSMRRTTSSWIRPTTPIPSPTSRQGARMSSCCGRSRKPMALRASVWVTGLLNPGCWPRCGRPPSRSR